MGPQTTGQMSGDEVAAVDFELLFRNIEKNRQGAGYFQFYEPKASSSTEQNKNEPENVSTEESELVKPSANPPTSCRLKRLRYRQKCDALNSSQPRHRQAKNKENQNRTKVE